MTKSDNGGDHGSFEVDSSLPAMSGPVVPPTDPILGYANVPSPDLAQEANVLVPAPTLSQAAGPAVLNPLFCEQLR
ncbi:UNVERIFIED_CONTAM: hypothetical protein Sangu_3133600 [Sesamum angustifolium]|uniref:Uncharacterized protein n=1 Tax=Sesamum angustifolium TaxID=2727405 RepID=A0AAW2K2I3_9LAMI